MSHASAICCMTHGMRVCKTRVCSLKIRQFVLMSDSKAQAFELGVAFENQLIVIFYMTPNRLGLYGQVNKRTWWMPWRQKAMKDVIACDKLRGAGKYASIRRFPNGETHLLGGTFN